MTATDPLAKAKRLLASDPDIARRIAEAACHRRPTPEAVLLLASATRRCGDAVGAVALLGPLAAKLPNAWGIHFEHGLALAATAAIAPAIAALRQATRCNPGSMIAGHALRDLATMTGVVHHDDRLASAMADPALQAAAVAALHGDKHAPQTLQSRFGLDAGDMAGACLIADVGMTLGLNEAVARLLGDTLVRAPAYPPALLRQAEALHRSGVDAQALAAVDRVIAMVPDLVPALLFRGAVLMNLARESEAVDILARATELAPADSRVWQSYGHALRTVGRRDEALAAYRTAIRIAPAFGEAYYSMADLKTAAVAPAEIAAMETLVGDDALASEPRSHLHFALGRAYEDRGEAETAFAHYQRANALRRQTVPHDADAHAAFIRRSIATFDAPFFAERANAGSDAADPIFVLGMPRSGSSLVEQILASHPAVEGASELPDVTAIARGLAAQFPYPEGLASLPVATFAALGADYIARTRPRRRTDRPHFVDKFPGNVLHTGLIHLMLPNARIIDVRRDPRDCCVSLFSQSFAAGQGYSYDLRDLGRYYGNYVALMRHFDEVLPSRVLRVSYEALVDDPERQTRHLLDHCGLPFDSACLRFFETTRAVRTASSEQVRRPLYRGSIGRWRRFEPWLDPLLESLNDQRSNGL